MNKPLSFLPAFMLALSQMFSFAPKAPPPSGMTAPFNPSVEQSFTRVWGYVGKAVKDEQKRQIHTLA